MNAYLFRSDLLRRLFSTLTLSTALVGCGGGGADQATPPAGASVTLEAAHAASAAIGPDGGQIVATSASGVSYSLTIPKGALDRSINITVTPVASIGTLHFAGGLAGSAQLEPEGLALARPGMLTIVTAATPRTGQRLVGFSGTASGDRVALDLAASGNGQIVLLISHFSLHGSGFGTTADLSQFPPPPLGATNQSFADRLARLSLPTDSATAFPILHDWFARVIQPAIPNASNDTALLVAMQDYETWRFSADLALTGQLPFVDLATGHAVHTTSAQFAAEVHQAGEDAVLPLRTAISANNQLACQQQNFTALANVFFWQSSAFVFGVDDAAHQLDLDTVTLGLCTHLRLVSNSSLAALQAQQPGSLDLQFAVSFEGHAEPVVAPFSVRLAVSGATLQNPLGNTDASGHYTTIIVPAGSGGITVRATVFLFAPGSTTPLPLSGTFTLESSGAQTFSGVISWKHQDTSGVCDPLVPDGGLRIEETQTATVTIRIDDPARGTGTVVSVSGTGTLTDFRVPANGQTFSLGPAGSFNRFPPAPGFDARLVVDHQRGSFGNAHRVFANGQLQEIDFTFRIVEDCANGLFITTPSFTSGTPGLLVSNTYTQSGKLFPQ